MQILKDKNVLIVGATGSIGSKTAALLAGSGAHLFLAGRNKEQLETVAAACKVSAERYFVLNSSQPDSVSELKEKYFQQFATIDILINAAGIGIIKSMDTLDETDFLNTLQANLVVPFLLMKSFLPAMKATKTGLIINIPGVLGKVPMAGAAAYCASKYGLVGMMQSIREEVKRTDIRITNLFLGGVDSAFWDNIDLKVQREKMIQAEEAAKAIWFLCQQPDSGVVSEMVLQPFNHQVI
ncbi:SDR family oxidoreductase [Methylobacter sp. S3L5C]|uniref:SDR family oxidoreductase n=1 Tax=Methylobacter sp. S3L5C TaxID=2839024 RepID=UPI001FADA792|nr:SDR family oxidoreductase [Methylobacter sp. S3L5C]UOA09479.1 SDR family oxidoreductase [Methylobacter sp. S3L5C]